MVLLFFYFSLIFHEIRIKMLERRITRGATCEMIWSNLIFGSAWTNHFQYLSWAWVCFFNLSSILVRLMLRFKQYEFNMTWFNIFMIFIMHLILYNNRIIWLNGHLNTQFLKFNLPPFFDNIWTKILLLFYYKNNHLF